MHQGIWSASDFFKALNESNRLARKHDFAFAEVSGLQGFLDAISLADSFPNVISVDDTSEGYADTNNSPHRRMVKTIYISMRHAPGDTDARKECFAIMQELFRQCMSVLIKEKTKLDQNMIHLDPRIGSS